MSMVDRKSIESEKFSIVFFSDKILEEFCDYETLQTVIMSLP